jgi:hypothetical protein
MEERRPRHIDAVWVENFHIAVRCQEAAAVRDRMIRDIERLSDPCRDEYLKHRMAEILKKMGTPAPADDAPDADDAAPAEPKIQEIE